MRVLAVADVEEPALWDHYRAERFANIDLVVSAGDLKAEYLEFLVTMIGVPLLYVRGNHDDSYARRLPGGCICVEDSIYVYRGVRIAGLGGCMRYRLGRNMYTEGEMVKRVRRLTPQIGLLGGIDLLLTHAPACGLGDMEDLPHRGFACFNDMLERWHPAHMVHSHVHREYQAQFRRELWAPSGAHVVNACGHTVIEVDEGECATDDWRVRLVNGLCMHPSEAAIGRGHFVHPFATDW